MLTSATAAPLEQVIEFDAGIMKTLSQSEPRYTPFPSAEHFTPAFGFGNFLEALAALRMRGGRRRLSLYIHIPFCESACYYCTGNKIVTKNRTKIATYLSYLKQEITMQGQLLAGMNQIGQLHFGGGTPTYLSERQMEELMTLLRRHFEFAPDESGEYLIEIDPRTVSRERVHALRKLGFNQISLGIQDFDADVQKAVNRVQSEAGIVAIVEAAREARFRSVSIDLIYGLPKQSVASMERTLSKVIEVSPDRIALYHYDHTPQVFKVQKRILDADLPGDAGTLDMLELCVTRLTAAGYVYIGMDHFAKPGDELAIAQSQGRLHRNFQGYSKHIEADLIACGVAAISSLGAVQSQNEKTLEAYYERLDEGKLPIACGIKLSTDDLLRRLVIEALMCNFELSIDAIEQAHPIQFHQYFAKELERLAEFVAGGLLSVERKWLTVTPRGKLLVRNICMVFERHPGLVAQAAPPRPCPKAT
jgi:oxygen-independent coproporphyrinogen-3 oxidase